MDTPDPAATGRGVGPSFLGHLIRDRSLRLAGSLAIAVTIPVAVLFYFQFRSIRDLGRSSAVVLRQLSQETADGVTGEIEDALKAPYINVLLRDVAAADRPAEPRGDRADLRAGRSRRCRSSAASTSGPTSRPSTAASCSPTTARTNGFTLEPARSGDGGAAVPRAGAAEARDQRLRGDDRRAAHLLPGAAAVRLPDARQADQLRRVARRRRAAAPRVLPGAGGRKAEERRRADRIPAARRDASSTTTSRVVFPRRRIAPARVRRRADVPAGVLRSRAEPRSSRRRGTSPNAGACAPATATRRFPAIIAARARPQRAMMGMLAAVMALGVFFVARAAAREVRVAEMKSSFVSSVSHDLKTPLALIQLFAETLELGRLKNTDRAQEYYRIINSEARKLTRLINNLLDFSKIEAGLRRYKREAGQPHRADAQRARVARQPVPPQSVHRHVAARRRRAGADRPGGGGAGAREPALERDEIFARAPRDRRRGRPRRRLRRGPRAPTAASASRRGCSARSSASSTASRPTPDRARRAPASGSRSSTT